MGQHLLLLLPLLLLLKPEVTFSMPLLMYRLFFALEMDDP